MKAGRTLIGLISFGLSVAALVFFLKIVNWVPLMVHKESLRPYESIEQVRERLNIVQVFVPSYFPEEIAWPPSKILAQGSPFPALLMEFKRTGKDEIILLLSQSRGGSALTAEPLVLSSIRERVSFLMHGNAAVMTVGECADREPCSMISWSEEGYSITALMKSPPFELFRIAESMHP